MRIRFRVSLGVLALACITSCVGGCLLSETMAEVARAQDGVLTVTDGSTMRIGGSLISGGAADGATGGFLWNDAYPAVPPCHDYSWSLDGRDVLTLKQEQRDGKCVVTEKVLDLDALLEGTTVRLSEDSRRKLMGMDGPNPEWCVRKDKDGMIIYYAVDAGKPCSVENEARGK